MAGEGVLCIAVTEIDLVARFHHQLVAFLRGGGVDLGEKHSGRCTGLGGEDVERCFAVELDGDLHRVALDAGIEIEIHHFRDDALAGFDAQELLVRTLHRAAARSFEIVGDRRDHAVVVGGGQRFLQQAVGLQSAGGELIKVSDFHRIAGREFEDVVVGEFEDILSGRNVFRATAGDLDIADGDGLAAIFEKSEIHMAEFARRCFQDPTILFLADLTDFRFLDFRYSGKGFEIRFGEGQHPEFGGIRVRARSENFDGAPFRHGDAEHREPVDAPACEHIGAAPSFAGREHKPAIKHDRGGAPGNADPHRAIALLHQGAGPDQEMGVLTFLRRFP